ncbi:MAG: radical SAM protein [Candidatus Parcubacteria bacterium]|nr:radical SAM protein [Candidatus Parcubacteria bacterium]
MQNKPKVLILNITERCNSRCVMCGIWKKKNPLEIDCKLLENFFKKNAAYLNEVGTFGFTGGEPFLAKNYIKVVKMLVKYLPGLKSFGHPTNALLPDFNIKRIKEALNIIPKNVFFGIGVSLDGIGKKQEEIRGIKGYFKKSKEFIEKAGKKFAKYDNFYIALTTTLSKNNLNQIEGLSEFADKHKLRITFRPAMTVVSDYIDNKDSKGWQILNSDRKKLKIVFQDLYAKTKNDYYDFAVRLEEGEKREYPCPFKDEGFILNPDGKIFMCLFSSEGRLGDINDSIKDIFYSAGYLKTQKKLINNVCGACSAECYTTRSSQFRKKGYLESQLDLLMSGKLKEFKTNLKKNKLYSENSLLKSIADFGGKRPVKISSKASEQEKIIYNTLSGKEKYGILQKERNKVKLDFSRNNLANLFLNLAKFYYIIKIYQKSQVYLNILNNYFKDKLNNRFRKEADNLEKRIKLI